MTHKSEFRTKPDPGILAAVEEFLDDCRARGLSPKTVDESYGYPLRRVLVPFCQREDIDAPAGLTAAALSKLNRELLGERPSGKRLSPHSVKSYLKSVNQFMSWASRQDASVIARAQLPRTRKRRKDVLSRDELRILEKSLPAERDRIIVRIMADTGARIGEVSHLRTASLVAQDRSYFLQIPAEGKTGERKPPITPELYRRIKDYVTRTRPREATTQRLFVSHRRSVTGTYEPLDPMGIYRVVRDAAARSGLDKRIHPHLLRSSAISHMVARGMHPALVEDITGASTAVIAEFYSNPPDMERYRAMMRVLEDADD